MSDVIVLTANQGLDINDMLKSTSHYSPLPSLRPSA
jgi:hypothetical protein